MQTSSDRSLALAAPTEIVETQKEIVGEFSLFDDWAERYQYIIDLGRRLPEFPSAWKTEENRLHGCQSQVWIVAERRADRLHYFATSDSAIVSGLIALLLRVYSDRRPEDILAAQPDFIREIQLEEHLSPTRSNGLLAMIKRIRQFAADATVSEGSAPNA